LVEVGGEQRLVVGGRPDAGFAELGAGVALSDSSESLRNLGTALPMISEMAKLYAFWLTTNLPASVGGARLG
jgi:hypothetical protein